MSRNKFLACDVTSLIWDWRSIKQACSWYIINMFVFQTGQHFNQSKLVISRTYSSSLRLIASLATAHKNYLNCLTVTISF